MRKETCFSNRTLYRAMKYNKKNSCVEGPDTRIISFLCFFIAFLKCICCFRYTMKIRQRSIFLGSTLRHCVCNARTILSRMSLLNMCGNAKVGASVCTHAKLYITAIENCIFTIYVSDCLFSPIIINHFNSIFAMWKQFFPIFVACFFLSLSLSFFMVL